MRSRDWPGIFRSPSAQGGAMREVRPCRTSLGGSTSLPFRRWLLVRDPLASIPGQVTRAYRHRDPPPTYAGVAHRGPTHVDAFSATAWAPLREPHDSRLARLCARPFVPRFLPTGEWTVLRDILRELAA